MVCVMNDRDAKTEKDMIGVKGADRRREWP